MVWECPRGVSPGLWEVVLYLGSSIFAFSSCSRVLWLCLRGYWHEKWKLWCQYFQFHRLSDFCSHSPWCRDYDCHQCCHLCGHQQCSSCLVTHRDIEAISIAFLYIYLRHGLGSGSLSGCVPLRISPSSVNMSWPVVFETDFEALSTFSLCWVIYQEALKDPAIISWLMPSWASSGTLLPILGAIPQSSHAICAFVLLSFSSLFWECHSQTVFTCITLTNPSKSFNLIQSSSWVINSSQSTLCPTALRTIYWSDLFVFLSPQLNYELLEDRICFNVNFNF